MAVISKCRLCDEPARMPYPFCGGREKCVNSQACPDATLLAPAISGEINAIAGCVTIMEKGQYSGNFTALDICDKVIKNSASAILVQGVSCQRCSAAAKPPYKLCGGRDLCLSETMSKLAALPKTIPDEPNVIEVPPTGSAGICCAQGAVALPCHSYSSNAENVCAEILDFATVEVSHEAQRDSGRDPSSTLMALQEVTKLAAKKEGNRVPWAISKVRINELALEAMDALDLLTDCEHDVEVKDALGKAIQAATGLVEHKEACIRMARKRLDKFDLEHQWWNLPFDFLYFDEPRSCKKSSKMVTFGTTVEHSFCYEVEYCGEPEQEPDVVPLESKPDIDSAAEVDTAVQKWADWLDSGRPVSDVLPSSNAQLVAQTENCSDVDIWTSVLLFFGVSSQQ